MTTPCWLSSPGVSGGLRSVEGLPDRVALGDGVSAAVAALRRLRLVSPQASSSVSVPGISAVSQLSMPAGLARSPVTAEVVVFVVVAGRLLFCGWGGSHGTVSSRSLC